MVTIKPISKHVGYSVETETPYNYYLLAIIDGKFIAGAYTKRYLENYVQTNISKRSRHLYEIIERPKNDK